MIHVLGESPSGCQINFSVPGRIEIDLTAVVREFPGDISDERDYYGDMATSFDFHKLWVAMPKEVRYSCQHALPVG
jgi:hypothetical protein